MDATLSERIAFIQKNSNLNQNDFAGRLSISQQYLSQLCNGKRTPSDRTITDICREFGCDEVWLRTGEGEPFRQETKQEQIMRFAVQTVKGNDAFRKGLVAALAKLDPEDWENLAKIFGKLNEAYEKE
jgi:transcriptional regulator with XRE-family HTH domain